MLAFEGAPHQADLAPRRARRAAARRRARPATSSKAPPATRSTGSSPGSTALTPHLDDVADEHADRLLGAHRRVRAGAGAVRRGLTVTAQHPVDVLGVQVLLPDAGGDGVSRRRSPSVRVAGGLLPADVLGRRRWPARSTA